MRWHVAFGDESPPALLQSCRGFIACKKLGKVACSRNDNFLVLLVGFSGMGLNKNLMGQRKLSVPVKIHGVSLILTGHV